MISIAMATYNGEKFLKDQLDSIISQTEKDWELIVCDDCSTDKTFEILTKYAAKDSRIHLYKNQKNLGFKKNFEKAIQFCSGQFIALSDQDDIWTEDHLEILLKSIKDNVLVCSNALQIDQDGNNLGILQKPLSMFLSDNQNERFLQLLFINYIQGCTCLFRTEIKDMVVPIPEQQDYHDYWLGIVASINGSVSYISKPTVLYRQHQGSVTNNSCVAFKDRFKNTTETFSKIHLWHSAISSLPMSRSKQLIYNEVMDYYSVFASGKMRWKKLPFFIKNYSLIHFTKSYSMFIPRLIKRFLFLR